MYQPGISATFMIDTKPLNYLGFTMRTEANIAGNEALGSTDGVPSWQPIETAPRDQSWVLLWSRDCDPAFGVFRWDIEDDEWVSDEKADRWVESQSYGPTHWMPLPSPPEPYK